MKNLSVTIFTNFITLKQTFLFISSSASVSCVPVYPFIYLDVKDIIQS